jgi:DNA-binding response OmpR family regulator
MGADDFLLKPIDPTALQLRLELTIRKIKSQNEEFTIPFGLNCFLFVPEVWTFENHMQYTLAPNTRCTISCPIDNKHSLLQILGTETPVPNQTHFVAKNTDLLKILTHPNTPAV